MGTARVMVPEHLHLNAFQSEALRRINEGGVRVCLVQLPTGCGKTRLAAAVVRRFRDSGLLREGDVVLVLSPRRIIREQIKRELYDVLKSDFKVVEIDSGDELQFQQLIASSTGVNYYLFVATPQLIVRRRDILGSMVFKGVVLDEAHHTYLGDRTSEVIKELVERTVADGGFALGLTATPTKQSVGLLGGNLLYSVPSAEAMAAGVLVERLTIRYAETQFDCSHDVDPWKYMVPQRAEEYSRKIYEVLGGAVSSKVLVVAPNVEEAEEMRNRLVRMMEHGGVVDAKTLVRTAHYRDEEAVEDMRWFREADRGVLITVNMADIGFDVPDLEVLVLARRFSSPVAYTQVRGRVLRKPHNTEAGARKAKNGAVLVDLVGSSIKLEPEVLSVESGLFLAEYESFIDELRGFQPVGRMDIPTNVVEFHEKVFDFKKLKEVEEYVIASLLSKPMSLAELEKRLEHDGTSQKRDLIEAACKLLKIRGVVRESVGRYYTCPLNAIIWLALREGVAVGDAGWVSVDRCRAEELLGGGGKLDELLSKRRPFLSIHGEGAVHVYLRSWERVLKCELDLFELERDFQAVNNRLASVKSIKDRIDVKSFRAITSKMLLSDKRLDNYVRNNMPDVLRRLQKGESPIIRLLVYGQQVEINLATSRLAAALSRAINTHVKVDTMNSKLIPLIPDPNDTLKRDYRSLLEGCEQKSRECVWCAYYTEAFRMLAEKIRKKLIKLNMFVLMAELIVRTGRSRTPV